MLTREGYNVEHCCQLICDFQSKYNVQVIYKKANASNDDSRLEIIKELSTIKFVVDIFLRKPHSTVASWKNV